jgi:hypothetical protein
VNAEGDFMPWINKKKHQLKKKIFSLKVNQIKMHAEYMFMGLFVCVSICLYMCWYVVRETGERERERRERMGER